MTRGVGKNRRMTAGLIFVLVASFCFGVMPSISQKILSLGVNVETMLACRFMIGVPLIWVYNIIKRNKLGVSLPDGIFMNVGGLMNILCIFAINECYQRLPGFVCALLAFIYVIFVVIIEIAMGKEKPYRSRMICLAGAVVGLIAVVWSPSEAVSLNKLGLLFGILSPMCYAVFTMFVGADRLSGIPAETVMAYMLVTPMLATALRAFILGNFVFPAEPEPIIYLVVLAVLVCFAAPIAFCHAVKLIGASTASMINSCEPVVAYFAGVLIMRDRVSWNATLGGALIILAILFLNISERRRSAEFNPTGEEDGYEQ